MDTKRLRRYWLGCTVVNGKQVDVEIEVDPERLKAHVALAYERRDRHGEGSITLCDGIVLMAK